MMHEYHALGGAEYLKYDRDGVMRHYLKKAGGPAERLSTTMV